MAGVITASESSWIAPFTGLSSRQFGKLITALRREGADPVRKGRPWSLPLEDRVLLVAAYWRTNLTLRQLAPLFGVSKSAADRIIDHLGPALALQQRRRFRRDTVLIADGTLVPTRDQNSDWLTVFQLPTYAPDLNPQEGVWSLVKRDIGNLAAADLGQITRAVKRKLKMLQYRPQVIDGCLAGTGLTLGYE